MDIHSHILPGLDDGAADIEESVAMLRTAWKEGITDIVATPHYRAGRPSASPEEIREGVRKLQARADEENIPVRLYPGNEILYFSELPDCLREEKVLTLNGSRSVLVEFLPDVQFRSLRNAAEDILTAGYRMILAHVERYRCLTQDPERPEYLLDIGVQFQINASSVTGQAGGEVKRFVDRLLRAEQVDYIGTDAHSNRRRRPEIAKCGNLLRKKYGWIYAETLLCVRAEEELGIGCVRRKKSEYGG